MKVRLHIEHLVLDGLPLSNHDGRRLQAALSAELTRLITAHGIADELRGGGAYPTVRTENPVEAADANPRRLGTGVANAVFNGIGGPRHE